MVGVDQLRNIKLLIPLIFFSNVASAGRHLISARIFHRAPGHYILIAVQGIGLLGYLVYVIRTYIHLAPLIAQTREEWRAPRKNKPLGPTASALFQRQ